MRVLQAAGLDAFGAEAAIRDPALPENLGKILQVLIAGMFEVLWVRAKIKEEFRLTQTQISAFQNNPLKLSVDVDEVMHSLFVEQRKGYLLPLEAVREGFSDIKAHEAAMLAGMQAAFDSMFRQFDPSELQKRLDRKGLVVLGSRKAYYWEQSLEAYQDCPVPFSVS